MTSGRTFALLGSPNAGKTTLFNALTGLRARVGNYPGVTVERREGRVDLDGHPALLIDLPGTYGLTPISADEAVVQDVLAGRLTGVAKPDALVLVADACSLERTLPFLGEALRLGVPACVVLTMLDELAARAKGREQDRPTFSYFVMKFNEIFPSLRGDRELVTLVLDTLRVERPAYRDLHAYVSAQNWALPTSSPNR